LKRERVGVRRKATAGIIAAVILFAMLFSVGTTFFLVLNATNLGYTKSLLTRSNQELNTLNEQLSISTLLNGNNHVAFYVNNTGGMNANLTQIWLLDSSSNLLACDGRGLPTASCGNSSPPLPLAVNSGRGSRVLDTGYVYAGGVVAVRVLTERGGAYTATYPPTAGQLATGALTSGAIGDIYLDPASFSFYSLCVGQSSPCNPCSSAASCNLRLQGHAFSIPASFALSKAMAFSLRVVNLNPSHFNITLDQFTELTNFMAPQGAASNTKNIGWFIISNSSTSIAGSTYSYITLPYNKPTTIVFASEAASSFTPFVLQQSNMPQSLPNPALIFVLTHGCKAVPAALCNYQAATYSQNSAYITTLYY
jgi:hypothetical protein